MCPAYPFGKMMSQKEFNESIIKENKYENLSCIQIDVKITDLSEKINEIKNDIYNYFMMSYEVRQDEHRIEALKYLKKKKNCKMKGL